MTVIEINRHHRLSPWKLTVQQQPAIINIYNNCFCQEEWKNIYICSIKDAYDCKKFLEFYWHREYHELLVKYLKKAYACKLSHFHKKQVRFQYTSKKKGTGMSLILGVDRYGYGWNLVGRALRDTETKSQKELYYAYICIQELKPWLLEEGRSLEPFWKKDPITILRQLRRYDMYKTKEHEQMEVIRQEFQQRQLMDWDILQIWIDYPESCLMMIVEYKYARFVFNNFEKKIVRWLWSDHKKQCTTHEEEDDYIVDPVLSQNILYLYTTNRLPVSAETQKRIQDQRIHCEYYKDGLFLQKMVDYTPYQKKGLLLSADDLMHPLHPFHIKDLCIDECTYRCVMEYVFIQILIPYLGHDLSYKKIRSLSIKQLQQFSKFEKILDWSINRYIKLNIRKMLSEQWKHDVSFRDVLLDTKDASLQYKDPYDPFIGHSPFVYYSNQWGKELERLRQHHRKK